MIKLNLETNTEEEKYIKEYLKTMKELDISDRTYYRWQSGESKPLTSIIITLAKYFNVSVDYLASEYINKND